MCVFLYEKDKNKIKAENRKIFSIFLLLPFCQIPKCSIKNVFYLGCEGKTRDIICYYLNLFLISLYFYRGGVLPYKSDAGARWENSRTPLKGTRIFLYGRVPKFISTRKRYQFNNNKLTGHLISNKKNSRNLFAYRNKYISFRSITLGDNLTLKCIETILAAVIFGFSTISGTNPEI